MNIIKTIDSLDDLNFVAYQPFITDRVDFFEITPKIAYVILNDLHSDLRKSLKSNIPIEELVIFTDESLSSSSVLNAVSQYSGKKLYPFSRKHFYETFFSNVLPSLADSVYTMLKNTHRITPIGGGQHKAFIINPSPMTEADMLVPSQPINLTQLCSDLSNSLNLLNDYIAEASFYEEKIAQRDQFIQSLYTEISNLHSQINTAYQTTWR